MAHKATTGQSPVLTTPRWHRHDTGERTRHESRRLQPPCERRRPRLRGGAGVWIDAVNRSSDWTGPLTSADGANGDPPRSFHIYSSNGERRTITEYPFVPSVPVKVDNKNDDGVVVRLRKALVC